MIQTFCNNSKMAHSHSRAPGLVQKQPVDSSWGRAPRGSWIESQEAGTDASGGGHPWDHVGSAACWPPRRGPPSCLGEGQAHRTACGHSVDTSGHVTNQPGTWPPLPAGGLPRDPRAHSPAPGVQASGPEAPPCLAPPSRELAVCVR